jgi:PEGA domain-containing protein
MNNKLVITILISIILIFGTVLAIRWAQGYRINFSQRIIEGTGLLVANSEPKGASLYIDDKLTSATDDTLHLNPGSYDIRLEKDGYQTWKKILKIEKELVTQTNAHLFPSVPNLSTLTVNSAQNPTPSPDGNKIAFQTASSSAQTKYGVWVLSLSSNFLKSSPNALQIIEDTPNIKFSQAQMFWSPDSNKILAYFNSNQAYLLETNQLSTTSDLINISFQLSQILNEWEQQLSLEHYKKIAKLPPALQKIATSSATLTYFSPNEEKLLYVATNSANLADNLIPPLLAINSQAQDRNLIPGNLYVYDAKEDTNYLLAQNLFDSNEVTQIAQSFYLPPPPPETFESPIPTPYDPKPKTNQLTAIDRLHNLTLHYSPIYSSLKYQWYPHSSHLIITEINQINIIEYDGTNLTTVFPGGFAQNFSYPWPTGEKLIILTSLGSNSLVPNNLYSLNLK